MFNIYTQVCVCVCFLCDSFVLFIVLSGCVTVCSHILKELFINSHLG